MRSILSGGACGSLRSISPQNRFMKEQETILTTVRIDLSQGE